MPDPRLRILLLYPEQLNIYADRGNILFLRRRCEWRGIGFEALSCGLGEPVPSKEFDFIYIGGGQDRDQAACAADLHGEKANLVSGWYRSGRAMLAVCGGYQLLGSGYEADIGTIDGINAADIRTVAGKSRLIGPVAVSTGINAGGGDGVIAGFENHAGRTVLGPGAKPLGTVLRGNGNDGHSGDEGVINGRAVGTYIHGPLLPKNWWLADWLIAGALGLELEDLGSLDDRLERRAHASARRAAGLE